MTDEERWQIEGKLREDHRASKRNLAALRAQIEQYADELQSAGDNLRHFLASPSGTGPTGMTARQYANHFFQKYIPPEIAEKLTEFEAESEKLSRLESTIREFDK